MRADALHGGGKLRRDVLVRGWRRLCLERPDRQGPPQPGGAAGLWPDRENRRVSGELFPGAKAAIWCHSTLNPGSPDPPGSTLIVGLHVLLALPLVPVAC